MNLLFITASVQSSDQRTSNTWTMVHN